MKLRRLLMGTALALPLLFGAPSVARADPVSAAIITTLGFTATASAVAATTSFLINAALFAATTVATKLMGKGKANVAERQASVTSLSLGEVPRAVVLGMTCIGGSLVDIWNWGGQYGTDNVTRCIALADHACEGLYGYYVDDVFYRYLGPGVQPGFNGTLTIEFRNATPTGHAPPSMATAAGWAAADRMTAMAHVWVTTKFDDKVWTQGHPRFRWVLHGLQCFDPRNGDVWSDRSTHSFTRNPILQRYAFARGIYAEGRQGQAQHLLIGRGLSEIEAPPERIIAAANLCDEDVNGLSRYYADGEISADMDFIDVEQMFAGAVAGVIVQREGGVEVEPGQAKATVATIRDGDLVPGEPVTFSRFLPDSDGGRINTVVPRYVEPAQNYADHSGPVRRDLADIAADGGPREMTLSLPLVTGAAVADRNAEIARKLARLERRATIVLPPEYAWLEEGDWIAWQSDRRHDGATVRYRIEGWSLDEKWRMKLTLREIASSVFGVPEPLVDTSLQPVPFTPPTALTLPGANAEAVELSGAGDALPAIRFTWDTPVNPAVRAIRAEVRKVGETDASSSQTDAVNAGAWIVSDGVAPTSELQVRLVPIGEPGRAVTPGDWITVSSPSLVALTSEESEALERLARIESDNWLSKGEKPEVIEKWNTVFNERTGIENALTAAGLTSTKTAYSNAAQALSNYLTGLSPAWNNLAEDTPITGSALRNAFMAYYVAKQQANQALSAAAAGDASAALTRLTAIESDGVLSKGEKGEVIRQVTTLNDEYAALAARGNAAGATAAVTTYSNALTALNSYLTGLSPAWNNVSLDTPITGGTFRANFNTVYVARQAVMNAILGIIDTNASEALAAISIIGSDAWLSKGEKPEVIRQVGVFVADYPGLLAQATLLGVTTQLTAHANAVNALTTYLAGLSPAWNNTALDTPIVGATFNTRFQDAYTTRQTLLNALTTALNTQVGTAAADAVAALNRITAMTSDAVLSRAEKPSLNRDWQVIVAEYPVYRDQALAIGATTERTALMTAYADLSTYLSSLSPAYNDLTQDTPIVPATFAARFQAYYVARAAVSNAMIGLVQADADAAAASAAAALGRLAVIDADGVLSKGEKGEVIRQVATLNGEVLSLAARGNAAGVTTAVTAYTSAVTALNDYLITLSPAWNNTAEDTTIVPATFRAKFNDAYLARQALMDAILGVNTTDSQAALTRLGIIASDNWLSTNEKASVIQDYAAITGEYADLQSRGAALGVGAPLTTYNAALTALNTYLGGLSPAWNNLTADTVIVGATFRQRWADYYAARSGLMTALAAAAGGNAQAALDALARIASDNWLTANEKPEVIRQRETFVADYPGLLAQATALGITTTLTAHANAVNAMTTYLDGLSPAWNSLTTDTVIVGATLRSRFTTAYTTKQALENAIAAAIGADAQAALSRLDVIVADGWLSRNEKPRVVQDYAVVTGEFTDLINKGNAVGATAAVTAYTNAITNLNSYLNSLSPLWSNLSADTPIVGATFRSRWTDYYATKTALQTAISTATSSPPLKIVSSVRGISRNVAAAGTYTTTASVVLTITGGSGSYAWEWFLLSSTSSGPNANSASINGSAGTGSSGATTASFFTATVAAGEDVKGSFGCEIRDTVTGEKFTSLHTGRIVNTA